MRSKAPLALMEQMVMLLVFALAAALCLQAFVRADALSARSAARDRAVLAAQNAAEAIQHSGGRGEEVFSAAAELLGGSSDAGMLWLDYDENWTAIPAGAASADPAYRLEAVETESGTAGLRRAQVRVMAGGADVLFELETAWQEVGPNG